LSPDHPLLAEASREAAAATPDFVYRQHANAAPARREGVV